MQLSQEMVPSPPAADDAVAYSDNQASCHSCRQRKQKCSREQPSCTNCRRLGIACLYDARKRKPGLKTGVVEGLTKRVEALEKVLCDLRRGDSALPNDHSCSAPRGYHSLTGSLDSLATTIGKLTSKVDSLGHLPSRGNRPASAVSETLIQGGTDDNQSSSHCKRRRVDAGLPQFAFSPASFGKQSISVARCSYTQLSADLLDDVVHLYFMRIHNWIPILHWNRFKQKYRQYASREKMGVILDAMILGTLKYVKREHYRLSASDVHHITSKCRESVLLTAMNSLCVENLQALIILVFIDIGDGYASKAWSVIGSLSRTVEYLQLSIEDNDDRAHRFLPPLSVLPVAHDWIETEERRRVFWVIFNLDRFCSITTGWNTSLTTDDVSRRLPADGIRWYLETPVSTPFFGIWDKSATDTGNSLVLLPAIASRRVGRDVDAESTTSLDNNGVGTPAMTELQSIGGLAYLIEATESMSRIVTYFLRQKIDFHNEREVTSWLTRFKELDLRLVHWKMFLPKRWKDPTHVPDTSTGPKYHDHGMTLAHVIHNTSIIILHSRIAYSIPRWYNIVQLPSSCSAETCRLAVMETTGITAKYLSFCPDGSVVAPQFAFCIFISAKALLIHCRYYSLPVQIEFWTMVEMLQQMARRWAGLVRYDTGSCDNAAGRYAERLRKLHDEGRNDLNASPDVLDYPGDLLSPEEASIESARDPSHTRSDEISNNPGGQMADLIRGSVDAETPERHSTYYNEQPFFMDLPPPPEGQGASRKEPAGARQISPPSLIGPSAAQEDPQTRVETSCSPNIEGVYETENDLLTLSQTFMESSFAGMDRIIGLNDYLFQDDLDMLGRPFTTPVACHDNRHTADDLDETCNNV